MNDTSGGRGKRGRKIDRSVARTATALNLFATPGLGSMLAGKWVAGVGQLLLAVTGFTLFCIWFFKVLRDFYSLINDAANPAPSSKWWAISGIGLFALAWLWALASSILLHREARRAAEATLREENPD